MDYKEIKKIALDTAGDIKDTSMRFYKSAKISVDINKKQHLVDDKISEIGKIVYTLHRGKNADESAINTLCEEIDAILNEVNELQETKKILKANRKCEVCGCVVSPDDDHCPNCGCEL